MAPEYLESMGTVLFDSFFGTSFAGVILTGIRQMLMQFRVIPKEALYTFKG